MKTPEEKGEELWQRAYDKIDVDIMGATAVVDLIADIVIEEFKGMVPEPYKFHYKYWEEIKKSINR